MRIIFFFFDVRNVIKSYMEEVRDDNNDFYIVFYCLLKYFYMRYYF